MYPDLRIASVGHFRRKASYVRATFDHAAIGLVVAGQGSYSAAKRRKIEITPGALFGVHSGVVFDYGPTVWWEEYYLGFIGSGVRGLLKSGLIPSDGQPRFVTNIGRAVRGFEQVMHFWKRGRPGDSDRACIVGLKLLVDLFSEPLTLTSSRKVDPVESVIALCRKNPQRPFNFKALAADRDISYSQLRQGFVRQTQLPPAAYLARLRCQAACVRLVTTQDPIKRIARSVGIADPYTFSRTFKRVMSVSPRQYRLARHAYA